MKTRKYYSIWGKNLDTGKAEKLDSTNNYATAWQLIGEYTMAFGRGWIIYCPQMDEV